jgi:ParB/RepB/Spo0J family partition protein
MAKIQAAGGVKKISLAQIIANGNVREDYRDIAELAESIKTNGLLQPIAVKSLGKNADGIDEYELIAGHRRRLAFQYLCDAGDDFSRIDAVVVAGDKLTLQLVENLQRSDLTARERERGIFLMTRDGKIAQSEVAALLGKNEQFVYRNASAYKIRELTDKSGIDTSEISTNTLCEIAAAADGDIPLLIEKIKEEGGTLAAARRIWREHKGDAEPKPEAAPPEDWHEDDAPEENEDDSIDPDISFGEPDAGDEIEISGEPADKLREERPEREPGFAVQPMPAKKAPRSPTRTLNDFDPPHKKVDINDVLVIIKDYIDRIDETTADPGRALKIDAAWDIVALLHESL